MRKIDRVRERESKTVDDDEDDSEINSECNAKLLAHVNGVCALEITFPISAFFLLSFF